MTGSAIAKTDAQEFIDASRLFLREDFLPKLVGCLERMSEEDIWWRPNEASNSVGNLVLHLCGNVRQWIVASIGGSAFDRDRDSEFSARGPIPRAELTASIRAAVVEVDRVLEGLATRRLLDRLRVQGSDTSVLQAIYHVVEHFSYHLGQIHYVQKLRSEARPAR